VTFVPHSNEANAEVLYDFAVATILPMLAPEGVWSGTEPWPLPDEIIERQFKRIAKHENYKPGQTIMCQAESGNWITLTNGVVKISEHFDPPWTGEPR
jgi:hypothetical protein